MQSTYIIEEEPDRFTCHTYTFKFDLARGEEVVAIIESACKQMVSRRVLELARRIDNDRKILLGKMSDIAVETARYVLKE